jgi:hypothetical protein
LVCCVVLFESCLLMTRSLRTCMVWITPCVYVVPLFFNVLLATPLFSCWF